MKKISAIVLFSIGINLFYSYVGVYKFLDRRPCSIHSWAQCQRASIAQNYYKTDMNFFKPRTQGYTDEGCITGVEFPVIYYLGAAYYKFFGFNEIFLRAISLIIVTLGLFFFFLLAHKFIKNLFISILVVACAASSPVLLFYSPNFLPDAPSMGLALIAWYFFFKFVEAFKTRYIHAFIIFGTLAGLIKVVGVISLVALACIVILDRLAFFKTPQKKYLFEKPLSILMKVLFGLGAIVAWYVYANWLSVHYNNEAFCLAPVKLDWNVFDRAVDSVKNGWGLQYYTYESYVLMISAMIAIILLIKQANKLLLTITVLYILGSACYVIFFLGQFINHDYYIISILPCVFFLFLSFADAVNTLSTKYFVPLKLVLFLAFVFNLKECLKNCKKNYFERYGNETLYWSYDERAFYDLEPKLRQAGIKRTDVTLVAFDNTYCNRLYLMDQIGYSIPSDLDSMSVNVWISNPKAKYLVVNDTARLRKVYPVNLADKIVLYHRGLLVYKLR